MRYSHIHKIREDVNPRGRVAIIGAMLDGPVGVPFSIRHGIEPLELLGECPAARQATSIMEAGVKQENILFFRLNGLPHEIRLKDKNTDAEAFIFRTIGCSEEDKKVEIQVQEDGLVFLEDGVVKRTYVYADFLSIRELVTRINRDADSGLSVIEVVALKEGLLENIDLGLGSYAFYENDAEPRMVFDEDQERSEYLTRYMERISKHVGIEREGQLLDIPAEAFVFSDIHGDEAYLMDEVMQAREETYATVAFYGVKNLPEKTSYDDHGVDEDGNLLDENGEPFEPNPWAERDEKLNLLLNAQKTAHAAMVMFGEAEHLGSRITLEGALAARYVLGNVEEDLTNKKIEGFDTLIYDLRKEELAQLDSSGYICTVPSVRRIAVPFRSQFFRTYESTDIHRSPRLWRLGHAIGRWMTETLYDQIGEPTSFSLEKKKGVLEDGLDHLRDEQVINDYVLEVTRPSLEEILCRVDIRLPGSTEFITVQRSIEYSQQEVFRWME